MTILKSFTIEKKMSKIVKSPSIYFIDIEIFCDYCVWYFITSLILHVYLPLYSIIL